MYVDYVCYVSCVTFVSPTSTSSRFEHFSSSSASLLQCSSHSSSWVVSAALGICLSERFGFTSLVIVLNVINAWVYRLCNCLSTHTKQFGLYLYVYSFAKHFHNGYSFDSVSIINATFASAQLLWPLVKYSNKFKVFLCMENLFPVALLIWGIIG